jgi:hypothetical protein
MRRIGHLLVSTIDRGRDCRQDAFIDGLEPPTLFRRNSLLRPTIWC